MTVPRLSPEAEALSGPLSPAAALPAAAGPSPSGRGRGLENHAEKPRPGGDLTLDQIVAGTPRVYRVVDDGAALVLVVFGIPGPQGSKKAAGTRVSKRTGKPVTVLVESSKKVKPWREAVAAAAVAAGVTPLTGPLAVSMVFTLPRPQRMPKGRVYPTCYPDTSKLIRSTEDALTGHAWIDDAQVIRYRDTGKYYPGQHPDALPEPGAVIRIWTLDGAA